jgi:hypothetical protein
MPIADGTNKIATTLREHGEEAARRLLRKTLWEKDGMVTAASKELGVVRNVLRHYLVKLGLEGYPERVRKEVSVRFDKKKPLPKSYGARHYALKRK